MAYLAQPKKKDNSNEFTPKSSFIELAKYDPDKDEMTLTFKSGGQYVYHQVGLSTWMSFQQSPDHSSFYANAIKGNVTSTPLNPKNIGRKESNPLQKQTIERGLTDGTIQDRGIKRAVKRAGLKGPGTVPDQLYSGSR